jgi:hypothetical protein
MPAQHLLQVAHHRLQIGAIHTRQQQHELLTTVTEQLVGLAGVLVDQRHQVGQHLVANAVTILVVDFLEVVDVQQRQRIGQAGPLGVRRRHLQLLVHGAAVLHAGQRVHRRQVLQPPALVLVAPGEDVGTGTDHRRRGRKGPHLDR